jgi:hypothetical protein
VLTGFRRLFVVVLAVLFAVQPNPAQAHSASNTPSSNYVSKVLSITGPGVVPFTLASIEAGSRLELKWKSGPELLVPDYDGDPYLRIGPDGVFENQRSTATYLNRDRNGRTDIPDEAKQGAVPRWKKISGAPVARWHDHRAHRMGGDPPQVRQQPGKRHLVQENTFEILQGANESGAKSASTKTFLANVEVRWEPGPSPTPWLVGAGVLAILLSALSIVWGRTAAGRARLRAPLAGAVLILLGVDVLHLFGIAFGVRGTVGEGLVRTLSIGFGSFAAWVAAIVGLTLYLRRRDDGLYLITFAAGLITMVGGLADLSALGNTSVPFAFPTVLARIAIALTIGLGIGLVIAGVLLTRPLQPPLKPTTQPGSDPAVAGQS